MQKVHIFNVCILMSLDIVIYLRITDIFEDCTWRTGEKQGSKENIQYFKRRILHLTLGSEIKFLSFRENVWYPDFTVFQTGKNIHPPLNCNNG